MGNRVRTTYYTRKSTSPITWGLLKIQKLASTTNDGTPINVIPDAIQEGVIYEIKDTKVLNSTKQIQGEANVAKGMNSDFKIVVGEQTHVSENIPSNVEIIIRSDLGPQQLKYH